MYMKIMFSLVERF